MGIRWRDFTGASPSGLRSLLAFVLSLCFALHQFSMHVFQFDCRWYVIYLQFVFTYFSSNFLPLGSCSVSGSAFGRVLVSSSHEEGVFHDR